MNTAKIIGRSVFLSSYVEKLGIRKVTVKSVESLGSATLLDVNEEPGQFQLGLDVFETRAQAEAVVRDMILAFERQAERLRKCLHPPEVAHSNDRNLISGRKVVSKPGAAIKVTRIDLTPKGEEMLRVKRDVNIPGVSRKKTTP